MGSSLTDEWKAVREIVLNRDRWICQNCFKNKATTAHHINYRNFSRYGKTMAFDCVAVCSDCHKIVHPHMQTPFDHASMFEPIDLSELFGKSKKELPEPSSIWYDFDDSNTGIVEKATASNMPDWLRD